PDRARGRGRLGARHRVLGGDGGGESLMTTSARPFEGVSVMVTGGTRGIGRALVAAFAQDGAKVTFTGTNDEAAAATIALCPDPAAVKFAKADAADPAASKAAVEAAVAHGGGLDVLVNNAGITRDNLLMRMSDEEWDRVLDVNLK